MEVDDDTVGGNPGRAGPWYRFVKPTGVAAAVTVVLVLYLLAVGGPWDGFVAVMALVAGGTTVSFLVVMAGFYVLDAI